MSNNAYVPPGWYPDPSGAPQARWWDGSQWQEATQQPVAEPYAATPYAAGGAGAYELSAPAGTSPNTWQVWAINGLFALQMVVALIYTLTIDWSAYLSLSAATDPNDLDAVFSVFNGWYFATLLVSFVAYVGSIVLAHSDTKVLASRGVARPFHWAWNFIPSYGSTVYIIGRSVVVKRRTGTGLAPLWAFIIIFVVSMILSVVVGVAAMGSMMTEMSSFYPSY